METAYYTRKNIILSFIIGFIVGMGSYYVWAEAPFHNDEARNEDIVQLTEDELQNKEMPDVDLTPVVGNISSGAVGENSITIQNQAEGMVVYVDTAFLSQESWLAVREIDKTGELANILGAGRFSAGVHENIQIELSRNTVAGNKYQVVIYQDDGNPAEFDFKDKDVLLTNAQEEVLKFPFETVRVK